MKLLIVFIYQVQSKMIFIKEILNILLDYIIGIIDVLKNNTSWNSYNKIMNGNTLRKKHYEWIKLGVYDHIYNKSLKKYMKNTRITEELKYQSIDSTFIEDINVVRF